MLLPSLRLSDILSYEQHNFLIEYGPTVYDFLLSLPGIISLRRRFRAGRPSVHGSAAEAPLLELPDELLLLIIENLQPPCKHRCGIRHHQDRGYSSLSKTCRRIRHVMLPLLYNNVVVRQGWNRSLRALNTISSAAHVTQHMRTFELSVHPRLGTQWMPILLLAAQLKSVLSRGTMLHALQLVIPQSHSRHIKRQFAAEELSLPSIKALVLGEGMEFMVSHCSNVVSLAAAERRYSSWSSEESKHTAALVFAAGFADKLRHLELCQGWDRHQIRFVHEMLPNLESLALLGRFDVHFIELMPSLRLFKKLKYLAMPHVRDLDPDQLHRQFVCGTPYTGPGGAERLERDRERWEQEYREAACKVAKLVFQHLASLERLWIGNDMLYIPFTGPDSGKREIAFRYGQRRMSTY